MEINPVLAEANLNLGNAFRDLGLLDDAVSSFRRARELQPDLTVAHQNLLMCLNYLPEQNPLTMLAEARRFNDFVEKRAHPFSDWRNVVDPNRCLRVGFVSGDFRIHPVGFFIEGVLDSLASRASGRLELFAYTSSAINDELTDRIRASCDNWVPAKGLADEVLSKKIREDGIDILIDLSGHTNNNRLPLFAWKPAPVQVTWLGYFATTGVAAIDYLIADPYTLPDTEELCFTEKIWRLPETRLCFSPPKEDIDGSPLPALTNGCVTFGCFNNLTKINDAVVALWGRVLSAIPDSRLLLKSAPLAEPSVRQNILERFAAQGIDADRILLEGNEPRREYLAAYHRIDIALDPFPFPGGTTTAEGLWMGVPTLTLAGVRFVSRQGVGLLMNAGLPEWVATDADDYVARAVLHATDLQYLASLRAGLRQQVLASPIFDASRFAGHFETALRSMWQKWCAERSE